MNELHTLWQLVGQLSAGQKRLLGRSISPTFSYGQVYRLLAQSKQYNRALEEKVNRLFSHPRSVYQAIGKLNDLILEELHKQQADHSVPVRLNHQLVVAEMLYNSGLYERCDKALNDLIDQATEYDAFEVLDKALHLRQRLILKTYTLDRQLPALEANYTQHLKVYDQLEALHRLAMLDKLLQMRLRDRYVLGVQDDFVAMAEQRLAELKPEAPIVRLMHIHARSVTAFLRTDLEACKGQNPELLALLQDHAQLADSYTEIYFNALHHCLRVCYWNNDYKTGLSLAEGMGQRLLSGILPDGLKHYAYCNIHLYRLLCLEGDGQYKAGLELEKETMAFLRTYQQQLEPSLHYLFYYTFASLHSSVGQHDKARQHMAKIYNKLHGEPRQDIYVFALHSLCLSSILSGDAELEEYWYKRLQQHYRSTQPYFEMEKQLMVQIEEAVKKPRQRNAVFGELYRLATQPPTNEQEAFAQKYVLYLKALPVSA